MSLLRQSNRPLTAYEIARNGSERGTRITPAQVYRVLARLTTESKVQRIELLSAYLLPHGERRGFMICRYCRSAHAFPADTLYAAVQGLCRGVGFFPSRTIFEIWGNCVECGAKPSQHSSSIGKVDRVVRNETIGLRGSRP
jgi:Fur family zinc uptake transcriptional regulator